jgi:hypothetical protein
LSSLGLDGAGDYAIKILRGSMSADFRSTSRRSSIEWSTSVILPIPLAREDQVIE